MKLASNRNASLLPSVPPLIASVVRNSAAQDLSECSPFLLRPFSRELSLFTQQGVFMSIPHEFDTINTSKYLFLRGLSEPWDNALPIISQEAVVNTFAEPCINASLLPEIAALLKNANSIECNDLCRAF